MVKSANNITIQQTSSSIKCSRVEMLGFVIVGLNETGGN